MTAASGACMDALTLAQRTPNEFLIIDAGDLAAIADQARARGVTCEQAYDSLH